MCSFTCSKNSLIVFLVVFWLYGCTLLGLGIFTFGYGLNNIYVYNFDHTIFVIPGFLVGSGILIVVAFPFVACWGIVRESKCLLACFIACLFVILSILLGITLVDLLGMDLVFPQQITRDTMDVLVEEYYSTPAVRSAVDSMHRQYRCCGFKYGAADYKVNGLPVPESCDNKNYLTGCYNVFLTLINDLKVEVGLIFGAAAIIPLVGIIITVLLMRAIRDRPPPDAETVVLHSRKEFV
ncbi:leukocyte surface antigen CD53-like [Gigantopelta aegis]|uniref:leukocyte surface antigen CD53-like n=1 Tax=Gigantopelta aegis TaxID=1735272 RepID=UPI001B8896DE|nr:leukocyte surface antigen CD53-like [Gigantopelta aegis]